MEQWHCLIVVSVVYPASAGDRQTMVDCQIHTHTRHSRHVRRLCFDEQPANLSLDWGWEVQWDTVVCRSKCGAHPCRTGRFIVRWIFVQDNTNSRACMYVHACACVYACASVRACVRARKYIHALHTTVWFSVINTTILTVGKSATLYWTRHDARYRWLRYTLRGTHGRISNSWRG